MGGALAWGGRTVDHLWHAPPHLAGRIVHAEARRRVVAGSDPPPKGEGDQGSWWRALPVCAMIKARKCVARGHQGGASRFERFDKLGRPARLFTKRNIKISKTTPYS